MLLVRPSLAHYLRFMRSASKLTILSNDLRISYWSKKETPTDHIEVVILHSGLAQPNRISEMRMEVEMNILGLAEVYLDRQPLMHCTMEGNSWHH